MRTPRFGNRLPWLTLSSRPLALRRHLSVALPFRREQFGSLLVNLLSIHISGPEVNGKGVPVCGLRFRVSHAKSRQRTGARAKPSLRQSHGAVG